MEKDYNLFNSNNGPTITPKHYYGSDGNNYYELVTPKSNVKDSPLLVWLLGGAWVREDIEPSRIMANKLAEKNITTAILHYRLSQKNQISNIQHPAHLKDSLNGFTNITLSLKGYNKIYLGGHSAGAHL
ncbi:hypothetical protein K502DRAFT_353803, partial [Neoconidiobolus thromboides FSU 785]